MRTKEVAAIFIILTWWIWFYKFYLWKYGAWLTMLILACTWYWIIINCIISFFDFCFTFWESKETFDKKYNLDALIKEKQYQELINK